MKVKKLVLLITTILCISSNAAFAAPYEVFTRTAMPAWDYYKTEYDENGKIRYFPKDTTFSVNSDSNESDKNLSVIKAQFHSDAELPFDEKDKNYLKWVSAISKITVLNSDSLSVIGEEIGYEKKLDKLILKTKGIELNGLYKVKIFAEGYDDVNLNLEITKPAPKLSIKGDYYPVKINSKAYFQLDTNTFSYAFNNPVYDVLLDGKSLNKDDFSVINYLISIEANVIKNIGQHELVVKMHGYEDSYIKFIAEGEGATSVDTVSTATKKVVESVEVNEQPILKNYNNLSKVDAVSSATAGGIATFLVFKFDQVANASILKDQGLETKESKETLEWWNSVRKESARLEGSKDLYDWEDYVNKVSEAKVSGKTLNFENYIKNNGKKHNLDTFEVKYVLEDGKLGDVYDLGELLAMQAPIPKVISVDWNKGVRLEFEKDPKWTAAIRNIKVNSTELYPYEYTLTESSIELKNISQRFSLGDNEVTIIADGYKTVKVKVSTNKSLNPYLEKSKYYVGDDVVIKGLPNDSYGVNIKMNGEKLYEYNQTGQDNTYKVSGDKLVLNKALFKEEGTKTIIISADGYNDARLDFTIYSNTEKSAQTQRSSEESSNTEINQDTQKK